MWWYVARFKTSLPKVAPGVEVVFGQVLDDDFFRAGDEVWLMKEKDGRWLCAQPILGGRRVRMTADACRRFLKPAQPPGTRAS